ncbi:hypothetical protein QG37_00850 [Candidozyma auris]|uniref:Uncharacterized protein n=1 Tax=Candidozyma auris TaxID=498019 RepID=A0A0L0P715_CANAR|nr:hypothetical protein QG37_00850 [[Candida] auris]
MAFTVFFLQDPSQLFLMLWLSFFIWIKLFGHSKKNRKMGIEEAYIVVTVVRLQCTEMVANFS